MCKLFGNKKTIVEPMAKVNTPIEKALNASNYYGAKWTKFFFDNYMKDEVTYDKFWSQFWKHSGTNYKTVIGKTWAWCMLGVNACLNFAGLPTTMSPMAASAAKYGKKAGGWWFGSIGHKKDPESGQNHTFLFLFWYDKSKNQAACAGFNQNNTSNITIYDFDYEVESDPRWPVGVADGREVTREEFEKAFPKFTNYSFSQHTR